MIFDRKYFSKIKGDASSREFYRKKSKNKKSIIIYSKKEKVKNLLVYDAINKLLISNRLSAPKLINQKYSKNYIEVTDFGKKTVLNEIKKRDNKLSFYKKVINILNNLQKIKKFKIKNFQNINYQLPYYNEKILFNEAKLFCDWYVPKNISGRKNKFNKILKKKIYKLLSNLKQKNNTFVHRDFHLSNLMIFQDKIAIIDSQDAVIGNPAYDVASLIDDVRYKTSVLLKQEIYKYYLNKNKNIYNETFFLNDFEILSVLRNLKIIGIFSRLAQRDNKYQYLKFIPYAWKLIDLRCNENYLLKDLKAFLYKNFSKNIRNKYAN